MDYITYDKYLDQDLQFFNPADIPLRKSQDRITDYNGLKLLDMCISTGLLIANGRLHNDRNIGKYTFCSYNGQSVVDYLLLNFSDFDCISYFDVLDFNEYSDHALITLNFSLKPRNIRPETPNDESFISRKIVWDDSKIWDTIWVRGKINLFHSQLLNNNESMQRLIRDVNTESIDHVTQDFTRYLHDNAFEVFGQTRPTPGKKVNNKWFDENCRNSKNEFKIARNTFNRTKKAESRVNFSRARARYNRIKKKAKFKFKCDEGQRIRKLAQKQPRQFWKNIKSQFQKPTEKADSLTVDDLCNHFKSLFGEAELDNNFDENVLNEQNFDNDLDLEFSEDELRKVISSLKNNKSAGIDSITGEILKASFEFTSPFLLLLYNRMFSSSEYPRAWGEGIIAPVFKKGDPNEASNYRGITLISVLAKINSQLLLNRLTSWTENYEKITNNQFGFQKGKSVQDCIYILHAVISRVLNKGQKLYCIFIDYEKCFDKIDRSFLWQKLLTENVTCKLVRAIKSMYNTVKSCVKYKSSFSSFFESNIGLKQGDPSSPLLFMLFVNDIVEKHQFRPRKYFFRERIKTVSYFICRRPGALCNIT